jgi:hypothetical protein
VTCVPCCHTRLRCCVCRSRILQNLCKSKTYGSNNNRTVCLSKTVAQYVALDSWNSWRNSFSPVLIGWSHHLVGFVWLVANSRGAVTRFQMWTTGDLVVVVVSGVAVNLVAVGIAYIIQRGAEQQRTKEQAESLHVQVTKNVVFLMEHAEDGMKFGAHSQWTAIRALGQTRRQFSQDQRVRQLVSDGLTQLRDTWSQRTPLSPSLERLVVLIDQELN